MNRVNFTTMMTQSTNTYYTVFIFFNCDFIYNTHMEEGGAHKAFGNGILPSRPAHLMSSYEAYLTWH